MDQLTDQERVEAWKAGWHPSFAGIAIVNKDFTFRSANPQFCKLLGVTQAELIGQRFQDLTPPGIRELDAKNAQMVIDGYMDFYLLPKAYQFSGGRIVNVVLLVTRVPHTEVGDFQFFLSRIMLDESGGLCTAKDLKIPDLVASSTSLLEKLGDFLLKYYKLFAAVGAAIGFVIITLWEHFNGKLP